MTPLLEARDVCRTFRRGRQTVTALDHVSLTLSPGEALGMVGQSGSGKTTLLRALAGLLPVSSGQVLLEGKPLETMPRRAVWQSMQMVFQMPQDSFDPRQTLGGAIGEALVNYGVLGNRAAEETASLLTAAGCRRSWRAVIPMKTAAASASGLPLPVHWPHSPGCCCATRPQRPWM